jgi:hypothetical protein
MKYLCIKYRQIIVPNFFLLRVMAGCGFHPYDMNNLQLGELCLRLNKQNAPVQGAESFFSVVLGLCGSTFVAN